MAGRVKKKYGRTQESDFLGAHNGVEDEATECFIPENSSESDLEIHISTRKSEELNTADAVANGKDTGNGHVKVEALLSPEYSGEVNIIPVGALSTFVARTPTDGAGHRYSGGRYMCGFTIITAILFFSVLTVLLVQTFRPQALQPCESPSCVVLAGTVLAAMNLSVDPCHDFYEYACGNWLQTTTPPPSKGKWSAFSIVNDKNEAIMKKILDSEDDHYLHQESSSVAKVKQLYKSCMNLSRVNELGATPMLQLISQLGSWTVTSDDVSGLWNEDNWDLQESLVHAYPYGSPFFGMGVDIDNKNSSLYEIYFDQSGLLYSDRDFYVGNDFEKYRAAEINLFTEVGELLGGNDVRNLAQQVWEFEKKMAQIMTAKIDRLDPTSVYHPMPLRDLRDMLSSWIDLSAYMKKIFGKTIPENQVVMVYGLPYLQQLSSVIQQTPRNVQANYLVWSVISGYITYLPQSFQEAVLHYKHAIYGLDALPEHWKTCVGIADSTLPYVTGGLYALEVFPPEERDEAVYILNHIKEEFMNRLRVVPWMDETSRKRALVKARGVQNKIGYPEITNSPVELDKKYADLEVTDDFFQNALNIGDFTTKVLLGHFGHPVDKKKWDMSAMEVNAYYNPTFNEMVFPAGILHPPFFSAKYPMAMKFGALGMVMGHELTHGFDNQGRHFDVDGNMMDWWNTSTVTQFKQHSQCIAQQYGSYSAGQYQNNGNLTLGENIADNGGLKTAFQAYEKWLSGHGNKEPASYLPGLLLSERQMLFVGFAQVWCAHETEAYMQNAIMSDPHSYFKLRVKGTISNMQEFSDAFECPADSPMNPANKCLIW